VQFSGFLLLRASQLFKIMGEPSTPSNAGRRASGSRTRDWVRKSMAASAPGNLNAMGEVGYVKMEEPPKDRLAPLKKMGRKIQSTVPILKWLPNYNIKEDLFPDMTGGTGVGLVCLAQTLAHAAIATTLPIQGPYCAFVPAIAYGIMGTSPHASVSSGAIAAIIIADQLAPWDDIEVRTQLASLLALFTGLFLVAMGACNLSFLMRFLSQPTLGGFMTGGSVIICLQQFKNLLGYTGLPHYDGLPPPVAIAKGLVVQLPEAQWVSVTLGVFLLGVLEACNKLKKWADKKLKQNPKFLLLKRLTEMKEILATVIGVIVGYLTSKKQADGSRVATITVVGYIEPGLPPFHIPWDIEVFWTDLWPDSQAFGRFIMGSFLVAMSCFLTTYATAKKMALKYNYELDPSQEMIGLGSAGIAGSFFGAFSPSGSLSRTGLAADCGVRTQMGGFICATVIGIGLQYLTPVLYFLPKATLAAIIITSTRGLIDFKTPSELWHYWRPVKKGGLKTDLVVWTIAFIVTSLIGVIQGIMASVVVSIIMIIGDAAAPDAVVLGKIESMNKWRNVEDWQGHAICYPGVLVYEFRGPLLFVSAEYFQEQIEAARMKYSSEQVPIRTIILSFTSVHRLDISSLKMLEDLLKTWKERGIQCIVTGAKAQTRRLIEAKFGVDGNGLLPQKHFMIGVNDAFNMARTTNGSDSEQMKEHAGAQKIQKLVRRLSTNKELKEPDKLKAEMIALRKEAFDRDDEEEKPSRRLSAPSMKSKMSMLP